MIRTSPNMTIHRVEWHRNGISGVGFYAILFSNKEDGVTGEYLATVSGDDLEKSRARAEGKPGIPAYCPETRVIALCPAGGVDIERTMRGDYFHGDLVQYLIAMENASNLAKA